MEDNNTEETMDEPTSSNNEEPDVDEVSIATTLAPLGSMSSADEVLLKEAPSSSHDFVPLVGICSVDDINDDAALLDSVGHLFESYNTSKTFLPHLTKFWDVYDDACHSVKREDRSNRKIACFLFI